MNLKFVGRIIGYMTWLEIFFLLPSLGIAIYDGDGTAADFLVTMAACFSVGAVLYLSTKDFRNQRYYAQEGMIAVALSWIVLSVFGALPFWISGQVPNYVDALFETVSGFTTTGSSILPAVEDLSRSLVFWRSFTHWLGGMGVLVFMMAIVPLGSDAGYSMHLLRAESPGPSVGKLTPRMGSTAKLLYLMYFVLSVVCLIFYLLGDMPLFEALCHTFGTAGTGGFGVLNDSMMSYSPYIHWVTTIFMTLFGINFTVYFMLVIREYSAALMDEELRLYLGIMVGVSLLITFDIRPLYDTLSESLRHAFFQVSTIMTTTGYATADFDLWPEFSKMLLVFVTIVGASAGSTGGGLKVARVLLLMKSLRRNVLHSIRPNSVQAVLINKRPMDEQIVQNTNAYLSVYCIIVLAASVLVSMDGHSFETTVTAVLTCFNNVGPGLAGVGPTCNFGFFSNFSKLILTAAMLLGRLEIFPLLALFSKRAWNRAL